MKLANSPFLIIHLSSNVKATSLNVVDLKFIDWYNKFGDDVTTNDCCNDWPEPYQFKGKYNVLVRSIQLLLFCMEIVFFFEVVDLLVQHSLISCFAQTYHRNMIIRILRHKNVHFPISGIYWARNVLQAYIYHLHCDYTHID